MQNQLAQIIPQNNIESHILDALKGCLADGTHPSLWYDDVMEEPDNFPISPSDIDAFITKYNLAEFFA